jgi:hypothetical protein
MGVCDSKEELDDTDLYIYDTSQMTWDEDGNLRYGNPIYVSFDEFCFAKRAEYYLLIQGIFPATLPEDQIRAIMKIDNIDESVWPYLWIYNLFLTFSCFRSVTARNIKYGT